MMNSNNFTQRRHDSFFKERRMKRIYVVPIHDGTKKWMNKAHAISNVEDNLVLSLPKTQARMMM
jgi:hypothetical protein